MKNKNQPITTSFNTASFLSIKLIEYYSCTSKYKLIILYIYINNNDVYYQFLLPFIIIKTSNNNMISMNIIMSPLLLELSYIFLTIDNVNIKFLLAK